MIIIIGYNNNNNNNRILQAQVANKKHYNFTGLGYAKKIIFTACYKISVTIPFL